MTTTQLLVETADLRRALKAVTPFTDKDAEVDHPFARVRIHADSAVTYVAASNGACAAVALVSTLALARDGEDLEGSAAFDVTRRDVQLLLAGFPGRDGKDGEPGDELRFDVDDEHLIVTDASGFLEGQSLHLGRTPDLEHPANVLRAVRMLVAAEARPPADALLPAWGPTLALLVGASKVYDGNLLLELHATERRTAVLARVGESFLAVINPPLIDEDAAARYVSYRDDWARRLASVDIPGDTLKAVR